MKTLATALILVCALFIPVQSVAAQEAEMPVPNLVVKDADGKVMGQVSGFHSLTGQMFPFIVLSVEGKLVYLFFRTYGLIDRVASNHSGTGGPSVYFSDFDCTGDAYVNHVSHTELEALSGNMYGVAGPDSITGEYKLYRSTTLDVTTLPLSSKWERGSCINYGPQNTSSLAAEEVTPNPLSAFHGPTTAQPDRLLTISGGDRIP